MSGAEAKVCADGSVLIDVSGSGPSSQPKAARPPLVPGARYQALLGLTALIFVSAAHHRATAEDAKKNPEKEKTARPKQQT